MEMVTAQLQRALTIRIVLEQAKGVLAQVGNLEMEDAYLVLRRYVRDHGQRLTVVAAQVVNRDIDGQEMLDHARSASILP